MQQQQKEKQIEQLKKERDEAKAQAAARQAARLASSVSASKPSSAPRPTLPVGCDLYRPLVAQYPWPVETAMSVMQAESGCNPNSANLTDNHGVCMGSFGLFQVSCHGGQIYDPAQNVAAAYRKYQAGGWRPWLNTAKKLGII